MADRHGTTHVREGVVKYTKPPANRVPPSQRPGTGTSKATAR
jgi:hypothetical protein